MTPLQNIEPMLRLFLLCSVALCLCAQDDLMTHGAPDAANLWRNIDQRNIDQDVTLICGSYTKFAVSLSGIFI